MDFFIFPDPPIVEKDVSTDNFTDWVAGLDHLREMNMTVWEYMDAFQSYIGNNSQGISGIIDKIEIFATKKAQDLCHGKHGHRCRDAYIYRILSGYMYPVMLALCVIGNSLNIAVYSFDFMRKSVTVKILAARALTNSLFVLFLSFEAMKTLELWNPHDFPDWEKLYWQLWPYVVMSTNTFGSSAMWITVLMTLERYLYVVFPLRSKSWCTNKNLYRALFGTFLFCTALQSFFPVTRVIDVRNCSEKDENSNKLVYLIKLRPELHFVILEYFYHYLNMGLAIFIPMILMIGMSLVIAWRLLYQHVALSHYTAQKRCVTRITLSTTAAHLALEFPTLVVFMTGALHGSGLADRNYSICILRVVSNFLATCNASILFFIYLGFSDHFRSLLLIRLKMRNSELNPLILRNREEASEPGGGRYSLNVLFSRKCSSQASRPPSEATALIRSVKPQSSVISTINRSFLSAENWNSPRTSCLADTDELDSIVDFTEPRINGTTRGISDMTESFL